MSRERGKTPGLEPVRSFPYYKLQYRDECLGVWRDVQKKFRTLQALFDYAHQNLPPKTGTRAMIVEGYGSRRVLGPSDGVGH